MKIIISLTIAVVLLSTCQGMARRGSGSPQNPSMLSTNGRCGPKFENRECPIDSLVPGWISVTPCCGESGWCGNSPEHCKYIDYRKPESLKQTACRELEDEERAIRHRIKEKKEELKCRNDRGQGSYVRPGSNGQLAGSFGFGPGPNGFNLGLG
ncbi:unnamed protein product [Owenia fusiformis]|uniref:Uncharacterized protein n=1 Tax=Owenia fusiformis TaxID=6347 RepID=A0A8J1TDU0_OWEFU|nr:unnamed protein product [Owenia fusiformis]